MTNPFLFTAREFDAETEIYYYRARYYDRNLGRFLSEDPIEFRGGANFYRYTKNNPVNLIDPSGLLVEVICEPVQQKALGFLLGARHCRLHVNYDDVNEVYELEGAKGLNKETFDPSRPGYRVPLDRPKGGGCDDFEKCVRAKYLFYEAHIQSLPDYGPVNSNSNAFVLEIVRSCGGDIRFSTFQFLNPLSWYHFYGQMPDK